MASGMQIDDSAFQRVLVQYASLSSKEIPDVLNKVARDVGLTAAHLAPRATRAEIMKISDAWHFGNLNWVKHISTILKNDASAQGTQQSQQKIARVKKALEKAGQGHLFSGLVYHLRAKAVSDQLLKRRVSSIGFLAHSFAVAARLVDPHGNAAMPAAKHPRAKGWAKSANIGDGDRPVAKLMMAWDVSDAAKKPALIALAERTLAQAMERKRADMIVYIQRKMDEIARKVSRN